MRFVVDMNLSPDWAIALAADGHDAVHWRDVGRGDTPDDEIIVWAAREGRAVFTADLGFGAKLAIRRLKAPSVVQPRTGSRDPLDVGVLVRAALGAAGSKLTGGAILTIEANRTRLRAGPDTSDLMDNR